MVLIKLSVGTGNAVTARTLGMEDERYPRRIVGALDPLRPVRILTCRKLSIWRFLLRGYF